MIVTTMNGVPGYAIDEMLVEGRTAVRVTRT
jgi:hypothetical protein